MLYTRGTRQGACVRSINGAQTSYAVTIGKAAVLRKVPTGAVALPQRCDLRAVLLLVGSSAPAQLQQLLALPAHGRAVRAGRCLVRRAALIRISPLHPLQSMQAVGTISLRSRKKHQQ